MTDDRRAANLVSALLRTDLAATGAAHGANGTSGTDAAVAVRIDGRPITTADAEEYRSRVSVSPHNASLFSGTVAENLDHAASPELRRQALAAAACGDFAAGSDDNADIGEMGARHSGGQRQRLALVRTLPQDALVLVLHDPTTAVDSVTELAVAQGLHILRAGRLTLLVTSSPALLATCDRIVDMRHATNGGSQR